MRWEELRADRPAEGMLPLDLPEPAARGRGSGRAGLPLAPTGPVIAGTEDAVAIEIQAKSLINRVPATSDMPFQWTINPYRGCTHACVYCFARNTHTYLDLDAGHDFDSKIVVKVNAGPVLRRELASPRWHGEPIAMGTNVDCYQRVEGRYRLMREILSALRDHANPFSILTKGTLIQRDMDLLCQAAEVTDVSVAFSIGFLDETLWRHVEPGTPSPSRRLDLVRRFADAGLAPSVLMAPILPGLTDTEEHLDRTVGALVAAGARSITPIVLHLRPGAREWYQGFLRREYPRLLEPYRRLYRDGSYAPSAYQREVTARVRTATRRHGLRAPGPDSFRRVGDEPPDGASPVPPTGGRQAVSGQLRLL
ncbi:Rv2578c family radical SAM protein [Actinocatenispora rupis]|uniref:Radical SAM protein n=1 Tax=Actinocatenispora rupis TaxID=519421 RepID=A0A8J3JG83_9ACTN|nr:Rv2578c family radical SAM protein [Actinocatenispora rupis]GID16134.1 radical SAM protein [Actinocatenispora rupis]